ncbi:MAG: hypothetical protein ACTSYI_07160 [Promethearchaeota archaeon]
MFDRDTKQIFKTEKLDQVRDSLSRVKLIKEQSKIIDDILEIALRYINMDDLALRGFIMLAIQEWQKKRMIKIGELRTMVPVARMKMVSEIFKEAENLLMGVLKNEQDRDLIKQASSESYQVYAEEFGRREIK